MAATEPDTTDETAPDGPPPFLDVRTLLARSRPQQRVNWFGYGLVGVAVALFVAGAGSSDRGRAFTEAVVLTAMVGLFGATSVLSYATLQRYRRQARAVDAVEEMVQLRRWEPAGMMLDRALSVPVATPSLWVRLLVQLSTVLARHHRFEDAIEVHNFLLGTDLLDPVADYGIRVRRAMAMLQEDHLVDADRAISDLRRRTPAGRSGEFALVELYRDVKTGHAAEAVELFDKQRDVIRDQLGHRLADAYALLARAYDLLGRPADAAVAYTRATLLAPVAELGRRYPEVLKLAGQHPPAAAPREVA